MYKYILYVGYNYVVDPDVFKKVLIKFLTQSLSCSDRRFSVRKCYFLLTFLSYTSVILFIFKLVKSYFRTGKSLSDCCIAICIRREKERIDIHR
jgi:hypothetical protein